MDTYDLYEYLTKLAREDNFVWLYEPKTIEFMFDTGTRYRKIPALTKENIEWAIANYGPKGAIVTYLEE